MPVVRVLGIDPGISGGAAVIDADTDANRLPTIVDVIDLPTAGTDAKREIAVPAFLDWLAQTKPHHAFIELVHAMPSIPDAKGARRGMGAASAFKFGLGVGMIRAAVIARMIPCTLVTPQKWKGAFGLKGSDKENSRQLVLRLFPSHANWFARKMDHQRAEALLIAVYGSKGGLL